MNSNQRTKVLSLYACRKLIPIVSIGKYAAFLGAIFFRQENTVAIFVVCVSLVLLFISMDTFLKISAWKCPHCKKALPHDFYSRKTMTNCPACGADLDFSDKRLFVEAVDTAEDAPEALSEAENHESESHP